MHSAAIETKITDVRYEEVPLRAIDFCDERFRTSPDVGLEGLVQSIGQVGLISPPILCRRGRRYILVTGRRRTLACRALGIKKIRGLITEERDDIRLLLTGLAENLTTRELGLSEKAILLQKLGQFGMPTVTLVQEYMPRLGLPATANHLRLMVTLAGAGRGVQDFFAEKSASLAVVKALLRFPSGDRRLLLPLLRPLGKNKQIQLLEDLWEIGRRDELPVRRLFRRTAFRRILGSPRLTELQKAEKVRQQLRNIRYPCLSASAETFRSKLRTLGWPRGISAQPSAFFEENKLTVSFRIGSREEFRKALDKLASLADREDLAELFRGKN